MYSFFESALTEPSASASDRDEWTCGLDLLGFAALLDGNGLETNAQSSSIWLPPLPASPPVTPEPQAEKSASELARAQAVKLKTGPPPHNDFVVALSPDSHLKSAMSHWRPPDLGNAKLSEEQHEMLMAAISSSSLAVTSMDSTERSHDWSVGFPKTLGPNFCHLRFRLVMRIPHARAVDWHIGADLVSLNKTDFYEPTPLEENGHATHHPDLIFQVLGAALYVAPGNWPSTSTFMPDGYMAPLAEDPGDPSDDCLVFDLGFMLECRKGGPRKRDPSRKIIYLPLFHFAFSLRSEALGREVCFKTPRFVHRSRVNHGVYDRSGHGTGSGMYGQRGPVVPFKNLFNA